MVITHWVRAWYMPLGPKGVGVSVVPEQSFTECPGCRVMKLETNRDEKSSLFCL